MRTPRPGDRIKLLAMPDDPNPIPIGTRGTVRGVRQLGNALQIDVDWENGRALMLVVPPDRFAFVPREASQ